MPEKRTYADRRDALIKAVRKRRKKVKELSVEYKGGKCIVCGYSKCIGALELHHTDPKQKSFGIGHKGYTRAWEKFAKNWISAFCYVQIAIEKSDRV